MKQILVLAFLCAAFAAQLSAQSKFTVSGSIKDAKSGEELIGATVKLANNPSVGTAANEYGYYSLTLPAGKVGLVYEFIGYQPVVKEIDLNANQTLNVQLGTGELQLEVVEVVATKENENVQSAQMGVTRLDMKEAAKVPVIFGEKDILKTIQLMPGVKSAGEGNSGFLVRGGSADQNLILLDEAPVYNASHLLGFFSTFNSDAIKDATLIKGNAPPQYGGRLASVLDIKMKEGNDKTYGVSGGIGLISSRLNVEGPIVKEKGSFLISGRRTYADMFLKLSSDASIRDNQLYFYDVNVKANYRITAKDRIFLSGYFGRDKLGFGDQFGIDWGNKTGTLRWNHIMGAKLFSNTSLIYSDYDYQIKINSGALNIKSQIQDWNLKQEFQFFPNPNNSWRFGANVIYHTITPGQISSTTFEVTNPQKRYSLESALYAGNEQQINSRLQLQYGLRLSIFNVLGGSDYFNVSSSGVVTDTIRPSSGSVYKTYFNLEPRASLSYLLTEKSSLKVAYARNTQHMHLLSNTTSTNPTDRWVANSNLIRPEIADQVSAGYFQNFGKGTYELSAEAYYKTMQNQVDYRDGANLEAGDAVEKDLLFGDGRAYGLELQLRKKTGKLTGWISYTFSRTERQIAGINNGNWYAARQDRTHDIALVGIYQLSKKWSLSATWVYQTGNAVTFPSGKYILDGVVQNLYTERNGYRMPAYHRLDLGATVQLKKTKRWDSELNFSLYNAYGRENAYTITFREKANDPSKSEAVQTSLFRWVPSVTWNFKFN